MREVQTGYEQCAAEYQQRIKTLNPSENYDDGQEYTYEYEYEEETYDDDDGTAKRRRRRRQSSGEGEESVKLLCCSFQKYLHCSESVVNGTCGYETAKFTKSFLDRMSGPLIQVFLAPNHRCASSLELEGGHKNFCYYVGGS